MINVSVIEDDRAIYISMDMFVLFKSLLTEEEIKEAENNKRPTKNRGRIYRYNMSQEELLAFVGRKLKLYYSQNNL